MPNAILWKNPHIRFMKQELTIAVALLAIGGLLWLSSSGSNLQSQQANNGAQINSKQRQLPPSQFQTTQQNLAEFASEERLGFEKKNSIVQNSIVQASYQQPVTNTPIENANPNLLSTDGSPLANRAYLHPNSNPISVDLLAEIAKEITNSKPFALQLSLQATMFGQNVVATGDYYQQGQGSRKTKIELSFDQMPGQPKMLHLCDGRFVYTIQSTGGANDATGTTSPSMQSLEFVDLLRVENAAREEAGETTAINPGFVSPIVSPTGWVATGGIASLLQHLASGFNFGPPEPLDPNSDRILLRGAWDENALKGVVADLDRRIELGSPIEWEKVPLHIPHAIELVLTRKPNQTYFPSQVSFLRFDIKEHQATIEPTMSLTFSAPRPLTNLAEGFFVVDSSNLEPTDATDRYIARIESFHQTLRSNVEQIAIQRKPAIDILTK